MFDLLSEPLCSVRWSPDRDPPPTAEAPGDVVSLQQLLVHAHEIADLSLSSPPAESALLRVLAVLTARITGLDGIDDVESWCDRRDEVLRAGRLDPAAIDRYLSRYPGRFDLFGDRPFLQDARLRAECRNTRGEPATSGVNKLMLGRSAGQSFVWQSHTTDDDPPPAPAAEAFAALLAWLFYGPGGRCTSRWAPGQDKPAADTRISPLRGTTSFHPWGSSLFETLLIGLPFLPSDADDLAPWEEDDYPDPLGMTPPPRGIARLLVGRCRHALLLTPSDDGRAVVDARITWASRREPVPALDPFLIHRANSKDPNTLFAEYASADRAAWRDLDALVGRRSDAATAKRRRPAVFDTLAELAYDGSPVDVDAVRIRALGFDQDRSQAKDHQYFGGTTPPVLRLLTADDAERSVRVTTAIDAAEAVGANLRAAFAAAWAAITRSPLKPKQRDDGVPWLYPGMTRYWARAESRFWATVTAPEPPQEHPRNLNIQIALHVYSELTDGYARSPEEIRAVEIARRLLLRGWKTTTRESRDV
ncbi:CRISPR system Cascade subunit CasA [Actinoalloteichus hoggarensis]|uniref:CRISPR-associated protein CasA/Cse1 n=1 Tax=Actinoalloteichus hoggarensis TaxID=1470176 RepID=A0A221W4J8_9PSEU|nr:type I-E CRISPR-associated protein Cse1/CasA [Actinoalloteichus hoggarensis]ASO20768.1 CRISPR-associated protein CasA/Cse1 [Actinoalloteichus hoggarensis]MBB5920698.1 CRISPR system Cascade subunit CasA [Actinoalloteichus hoggarensis]